MPYPPRYPSDSKGDPCAFSKPSRSSLSDGTPGPQALTFQGVLQGTIVLTVEVDGFASCWRERRASLLLHAGTLSTSWVQERVQVHRLPADHGMRDHVEPPRLMRWGCLRLPPHAPFVPHQEKSAERRPRLPWVARGMDPATGVGTVEIAQEAEGLDQAPLCLQGPREARLAGRGLQLADAQRGGPPAALERPGAPSPLLPGPEAERLLQRAVAPGRQAAHPVVTRQARALWIAEGAQARGTRPAPEGEAAKASGGRARGRRRRLSERARGGVGPPGVEDRGGIAHGGGPHLGAVWRALV